MSALGYHYPAGAEHDPSAPWNQPGECEKCEGIGEVFTQDEDGSGFVDCEHCNGLGREKTRDELRAEWEEGKADMERDET